jgi:transposase-like protein
MQQFAPLEELFKGRHFDQEIVVLCVRWYLSFKLSYRDLVAMMADRGIDLAHTKAGIHSRLLSECEA